MKCFVCISLCICACEWVVSQHLIDIFVHHCWNMFSIFSFFLPHLACTLCAFCIINTGKWHLRPRFTLKIKKKIFALPKSGRMTGCFLPWGVYSKMLGPTFFPTVLLFTVSYTAANSVFMKKIKGKKKKPMLLQKLFLLNLFCRSVLFELPITGKVGMICTSVFI